MGDAPDQAPDDIDGTEEDAVMGQLGASSANEVQSEEAPESSANGVQSEEVGESLAKRRRRVTRACDACRKGKIKCSGKQPCTHCTVYSYACTYDQPSNRRRNPAPHYVEAVEQRLNRAETLLRMFLPDLDLDDPSVDTLIQQRSEPAVSRGVSSLDSSYTNTNGDGTDRHQGSESSLNDPNLESMVRAVGQLDIDERGDWDYHGHSSGLSFIQRMREQFGDIPGPEQTDHSQWRQQRSSSVVVDAPKMSQRFRNSNDESDQFGVRELPPRDTAVQLCSDALDDASAILMIVHQPSFYKSLDRIYSIVPSRYENQDHRFLPLLYVVFALGCLFEAEEQPDLDRKGYKSATEEGYKYFRAARQLMDITECRDLTSLQAIVFMILFLQCSAKLSTCYSYVGIALRSAMGMGMHRSFRDNFNPIEAETRKRVFWVIRKMDIYVGAMLGLPLTLSDDDIDQDFPTETDDVHITETGIRPMSPGKFSFVAAANANFRLSKIVAKIIRSIYPIKGLENREQHPRGVYYVSYTLIREIENDLQAWMEDLPTIFKPGLVDTPSDVLRVQQLLRLGYAHAQMLLYRPFLHYVSAKTRANAVDQRSYACAFACVSVARNIIHITADMKRKGLLVGSYWYTMYTTFFAVLSLVYFACENPSSSASHEAMRDAHEGKETLARLAKRSMIADRCTATLTVLFKHLATPNYTTHNVSPDADSHNRDASTTAQKSLATDLSNGNYERKMPPERSTGTVTHPKRKAEHLQHTVIAPRPPTDSRMLPKYRAAYNIKSTTLGYPASPMQSESKPSPSSFLRQMQIQQSFESQQQQQEEHSYLLRQQSDNLYSGNISDLSAMMFPSADPFAYPNQPMTTLDQEWPHDNNNPFAQNLGNDRDEFVPTSAYVSGNANIPSSYNDQMDAQMLGPLPPYLMHHSGGAVDVTDHVIPESKRSHEQGVLNSSTDMWIQQARTHGLPGMNLDHIFGGEDWRDGMNGGEWNG